MKYQATIGLEVHIQLKTHSKMFCGCTTAFGAPPNTQVCPVCLGYPGTLPVMNKSAIRLTVLAGLMIGSKISSYSKFDRKNYFYPDMPKNYQISQYDKPLCEGGEVEIDVGGTLKMIGITRIHLEEDVGKNMHFGTTSGVDFNRAGVPLMEVVSEPVMHSADDAYAFLQTLKQIMVYAGVSDCNLEQGNLRVDVNCSIKPEGESGLGTKTEIKNMNTFKGVHAALQHEIQRQIEIVAAGGVIRQETLQWDPDAGVTIPMRSKEQAHDYRYFPEPDLMPVVLARETIDRWAGDLPERPRQRRDRFAGQYGIPDYDARVLVADKAIADFYEEAARHTTNYKALSNWMMTEMLRLLTEQGRGVGETRITPGSLAGLIRLIDAGTINSNTAKNVFTILFNDGGDPDSIVREKGLAQVSDTGAIAAIVDEVIAGNAKSAADFKAGKRAALQFLVGQVMKKSKGKANPQLAQQMLETRMA